jgi:hypothetical protein
VEGPRINLPPISPPEQRGNMSEMMSSIQSVGWFSLMHCPNQYHVQYVVNLKATKLLLLITSHHISTKAIFVDMTNPNNMHSSLKHGLQKRRCNRAQILPQNSFISIRKPKTTLAWIVHLG